MNMPSPQRDLFSCLQAAPAPITAALEEMATAGVEARGAVFTRQSVVEFVLDLVGYTRMALS
jgi:hypothetical protein